MPDTIAVIAAHADDEILGCGATMARYARAGHEVHVLLLADGETSRGPAGAKPTDAKLISARNDSADAANRIVGSKSVQLAGLPDNRLDVVDRLDVVKIIESFLDEHRPSAVFTHHGGDVNIDHRITQDAVIVATRPMPGQSVRELFFFEVPSSTEWAPPGYRSPFAPSWFVDVTDTIETKIKALEPYAKEMRPFPHPRSVQAVRALAQWRGATAGYAAAEAFVLGRKLA